MILASKSATISETTRCFSNAPPLTRQPMEAALMAQDNVRAPSADSKACITCLEVKALTEFHKRYGKERGSCKVCRTADTREWYSNNRESRRIYIKKYAAENQEKILGYKAKSHLKFKADPARVAKKKEYSSWHHVKKKYGLTREMWNAMFDAQGGLCALCRRRSTGKGNGRMDVDHCHDTGRIRGLLCRHCNTALGILGDGPEKMERVMRYLRGDRA